MCVKKASVEEKVFPIQASLDAVLVPISHGTKVTIVTEYDLTVLQFNSFIIVCCLYIYIYIYIYTVYIYISIISDCILSKYYKNLFKLFI